MPIITSSFQAKGLFKNAHFCTIYSAKLRPVPKLVQERERLELPDGDFIDLDWSHAATDSQKVAVLLHGLEGNAQRVYMKGQGKTLVAAGWDVVAMNHRGCSGEENLLYPSYNSGRTEDLASLVNFLLEKDQYSEIVLVGFSLGGNLVLKYLGEEQNLPKEIKKGIAISSPLYLEGSLRALEKRENWIYHTSFLLDLRSKYKRKMGAFPNQMNRKTLKKINSLIAFDHEYTAPAHGFVDAFDYYTKSSSLQFLPQITLPVLILNAKNDSFLSPKCFPYAFASTSKNVYLETPEHGGHVGFHITNKLYYSEKRASEFLND
jgi:predicted alpha/beta-fold hydrolase